MRTVPVVAAVAAAGAEVAWARAVRADWADEADVAASVEDGEATGWASAGGAAEERASVGEG